MMCRLSSVALVIYLFAPSLGVGQTLPQPLIAPTSNAECNAFNNEAYSGLDHFAAHCPYKNMVHKVEALPNGNLMEPVKNYSFIGITGSIDVIRDSIANGSLTFVSPDVAVTAAHNFCDLKTGKWLATGENEKPDFAMLGAESLGITSRTCEELYEIADVEIPGGCNPPEDRMHRWNNDLAIVKLKSPICNKASFIDFWAFSPNELREKFINDLAEISVYGVVDKSDLRISKERIDVRDDYGQSYYFDVTVEAKCELAPAKSGGFGGLFGSYIFTHTCDTAARISGGGVVYHYGGQLPYVFGVHIGAIQHSNGTVQNYMRAFDEDFVERIRQKM